MESERSAKEDVDNGGYYNILNRIPTADYINHTPSVVDVNDNTETISDPNEVVRINHSKGEDPVGASYQTKVYPGDVVKAQVYVKYADFSTSDINLTPIVSYVTSAFVIPPEIDGMVTPNFDFMNGIWYSSFMEENSTDEVPRAFLNAILLDNNLQPQKNGEDYIIDVEQVSNDAKIPEDGDVYGHEHEVLGVELEVQQEGYIYIYVSNEDKQDMDVYFDDLKVTHKLNDIVGGGDYYPYGSVMAGRQITRDDYRFGYQGQFSEHDDETGWNAFEARMYDAKIGRWLSPDPAKQFNSPYLGMGNIPTLGVDVNGEVVVLINFEVRASVGNKLGGTANLAFSLMIDDKYGAALTQTVGLGIAGTSGGHGSMGLTANIFPHADTYEDILGIGMSFGVHWSILPDVEGNVSFNFDNLDESKFGLGGSIRGFNTTGGAAYLDLNGTWSYIEGIHNIRSLLERVIGEDKTQDVMWKAVKALKDYQKTAQKERAKRINELHQTNFNIYIPPADAVKTRNPRSSTFR